MKNTLKSRLKLRFLLLAMAAVPAFIGCEASPSNPEPNEPETKGEVLKSLRIGHPAGGDATAIPGKPGPTASEADAGSVTLRVSPGEELIAENPVIKIVLNEAEGSAQYAVTGTDDAPETFSDEIFRLSDGDYLWVKVTGGGKDHYYKIKISIQNIPPYYDYDDPFFGKTTGVPKLTFSMDNMPTPQQWNTAGDMYEYPNPFVKMDGSEITNPLEWEAYKDQNGVLHPRPPDNKIPEGWTLEPGGRRAEIKRIVEYYHQGAMPPPPDSIEISGDGNTAAGGSTTLTMTYTPPGGTERTATVTATLSMPTIAPNGKPPSPENKVPLFLGVGSGGLTELRANGWATLALRQGTDAANGAGAVQDLFQPSGADRPSNLMRIAWEASRWMDAAEMGAWGGCVDASKSAVSGVSRNGKAAQITGSFAESQKGTRIAVSIPASSGGGGTNMERWTHQKRGLSRSRGVWAPEGGGYNYFGLMYLKNYEMTGSGAYIAVKIPPKDWEDKADIQALRTQIQNLPSIRNEASGQWVGTRMSSFTEQNLNFWMRGPANSGLYSTMPMDAHFIASLTAPNIWMGVDGWRANSLSLELSGVDANNGSGWVSQEPVYMTYLATRELYDFLGVEQNCAVLITMTGHAWPTNQVYAMIDYANWFFNKYHHPDAAAGDMYRRQSGEEAQPVHPIDVFTDRLKDDNGKPVPHMTWYNPMAREDYLRLNWKNPNRIRQLPHEYTDDGVNTGRSIAANVRAYFREHPEELVDLNGNPVEMDYPASMVPEGKW